ncbi:MAG: hypothetical protein FWC20_06885 [Oscillospiraceae bacterium]|nr:hypothetical protein [Oscillospiraceae bacterium]MCL2279116.1 hypothetical protein [Oscillospiraceae bacterium]
MFLGTVANTAIAAGTTEVFQPLWDNTAAITLNMSFSNGRVTSTGSVQGRTGTTAITATFTLERQNANGTFSVVDTWTASNGTIPLHLASSRVTSNQTAGTFRLSVVASVTRSGTTEVARNSHTMTLR